MTRITLHIGTHKTATTWLQNILVRQREALRAHGVLYPQAGFYQGAHHRLGGTLTNDMGANVLRPKAPVRYAQIEAIDCWRDFVEEVRQAGLPRVLVSSEEFEWFTRPLDLVAYLATALPGARIEVVVVLRRQDDYLESLYQEFVRLPNVREARPFWAWLGPGDFARYERLLGRWAEAVGWDAIRVGLFEVMRDDDLLAGYLRLLDLPPALLAPMRACAAEARERTRESLPAVCVELLRLCNQAPVHEPQRRKRLLDALYALSGALVARHGHACLRQLKPEGRQRLLARYAEGNEWIRQRFFPQRQQLFDPPPPDAPPALHVRDLIALLVRQGVL